MWNLILLLGVAAVADGAESWNFTVYSAPINLRYGEVYNFQQGPLKLPEHIVTKYAGDTAMAITGFDVEMVRFSADGSETLVKLSDHYLHHYILSMGRIETMTLCLIMIDHVKQEEQSHNLYAAGFCMSCVINCT